MSTLDIILIVVVVVAAMYGYYKGFVRQIGALAGIIAGIICCRVFGADVTAFLNDFFLDATSTKDSSRFLNSVVAQVVLFMLGYFGARWAATLLSSLLKKVKLNTLNRAAGAVFAVVQWLVVLSLALNLWIAIFPSSTIVTDSSSIVDERLINLAPDILGSNTAKEFFETTKNLAK